MLIYNTHIYLNTHTHNVFRTGSQTYARQVPYQCAIFQPRPVNPIQLPLGDNEIILIPETSWNTVASIKSPHKVLREYKSQIRSWTLGKFERVNRAATESNTHRRTSRIMLVLISWSPGNL